MWVVPGDISMIAFQNAVKYIKRYLFQSVEFPDGKVAQDFLHRAAPPTKAKKTRAARAAENGDILSDDEGQGQGDDEMDDFIVGGDNDDVDNVEVDENGEPVRRKRKHKSKEREKAAKTKRHKNSVSKTPERKRAEQESFMRQYKSADYVHDSDDEANPEDLARFFESERQLREKITSLQRKVLSEAAAASKERMALKALEKDNLAMMVDETMGDTLIDEEEDLDVASEHGASASENEDAGEDEDKDSSDDDLSQVSRGSEKPSPSPALAGSPDHSRTASPALSARPRGKVVLDSDEED